MTEHRVLLINFQNNHHCSLVGLESICSPLMSFVWLVWRVAGADILKSQSTDVYFQTKDLVFKTNLLN